MVKNPPALAGDARDMGLISGLGTSARVGNGYPLQCSCLGNAMDRGASWTTVLGTAELDVTEHSCKHVRWTLKETLFKSITHS